MVARLCTQREKRAEQSGTRYTTVERILQAVVRLRTILHSLWVSWPEVEHLSLVVERPLAGLGDQLFRALDVNLVVGSHGPACLKRHLHTAIQPVSQSACQSVSQSVSQ
jgi:hypothetical protein